MERINKLNTEVERKVQQAVEKAKHDGTPLDGVYSAVLKPMSMGGIWSGYPVYVHRPVWPTYVVGALAFGFFTCGARDLGVFPLCLCLMVSFLAYDLYSGILHVVLDDPLNIHAPLFGQPALEFQWHHHIPTDIVRKDFSDVVGDLNIMVIVLGVIHVIWSSGATSELAGIESLIPWNPVAATLASLKLFWAWYGQASHRMAHNPKIAQLPVAQALQNVGLMVSVKDHKAHHQPPHELDYCLIGVMNPVIDAMRTVTTNRHVWIGVWFMISVFEIVVYAAGCRMLCTALSVNV